jgi:ParB family chromosome partitioning protein
MTVKRGGLGRNFSTLLGNMTLESISTSFTPETPLKTLLLDKLQPGKYQPRRVIEEAPLAELAASIKKQGLLQPIIVRTIAEDQYEILAGERRFQASKLAGLTEVPVIIKQVDDETAMAIALIENLQREDLNALDQAYAMQRLSKEFALTHQHIADLLHKSRASVSNFLRLLDLTPKVKQLLENGDLDMGHARALLILNETEQMQAATLIVAKNLSVRETEQLVHRIKNGHPVKPTPVAIPPLYMEQINKLSNQLQTKIKVKSDAKGKGSLVIQYKNIAALQKVLDQLTLVEPAL